MDDSLTGKFLVASQRLRDPNFYRSVVLIVRQGSQGALGLVVNRPSGHKDSTKIQQQLKLPRPDQPLHYGGPVEPAALFILQDTVADDAFLSIMPGLFLGTSPQAFRAVADAAEAGRAVTYRVYAGCAGWGAGQLEGELFRNDWNVLPATPELVLRSDPYTLWNELQTAALARHRLLPHFTPQPELN